MNREKYPREARVGVLRIDQKEPRQKRADQGGTEDAAPAMESGQGMVVQGGVRIRQIPEAKNEKRQTQVKRGLGFFRQPQQENGQHEGRREADQRANGIVVKI